MQAAQSPVGTTLGNELKVDVLVADKSAHFRKTVRLVLDHYTHRATVREATDFQLALGALSENRPHLLLLDLGLIADHPAGSLKRLAQKFPELRVVVLLTDDLPEYRHVISRGADYPAVAKEKVEEYLRRLLQGSPGRLPPL